MLSEWLPARGTVLEIASGTGEHAVYFAEQFPALEWQPSDLHPDALQSIEAWRQSAVLPNLREAIAIDAASADWPIERAEAVLSINMVHISPWESALGLLDASARLLAPAAPLILYGPWICGGVATAESNVDFDQQLRARDQRWGLRRVEAFAAAALVRGLDLEALRAMPANNLMLLLRRSSAAH